MKILTPVLVLGLAIGPVLAQVEGETPQADAQKEQAKSKQSKLLDPKLKAYQRVPGISGNLDSVGSDTLNNLMTYWAEGFRKVYPNVRIQIEGKGSSTAPPALIEGTAQLGPMSRAMKAKEIDAFEKKFGYKPTQVKVAIDALAVYVHKDNPIEQLSLPQVDAIFSKTRKGGLDKSIDTWDQVGLEGRFEGAGIRLFGRNTASGTYGYFKDVALFKGDYRDTVKAQPGSASVVSSVAEDILAIGYSGIGYRTSDVKPLKLSRKAGDPFYSTEPADVYSSKYPLARYLYVYVNKAPNKPLDPLVREFLHYVLSRNGQETVVDDGYLPINAKVVDDNLSTIE